MRSPASRTDFSSAAVSRSASGSPKPRAVCQAVHARWASGPGTWARPARSRAHRSGHSDSTAIRARTSALRLVSCVDSTVPVAGQSRASRVQKAWNSAGLTPGAPGSPPTSLAEINGV
ncbi:hypothetical protein GCM10010353_25340 [Streptomyces chryseus]|nr:hypothetical protein GCM10010353_25340 [Streptomyces chryseus]